TPGGSRISGTEYQAAGQKNNRRSQRYGCNAGKARYRLMHTAPSHVRLFQYMPVFATSPAMLLYAGLCRAVAGAVGGEGFKFGGVLAGLLEPGDDVGEGDERGDRQALVR